MDKTKKLTISQIKKLKEILLKEKETILSNMTINPNEVILSAEGDSVDQANNNIEVAKTTRNKNRESMYLKKINKSLELIEKKEYGQCQECGVNIPYGRFLARPTSTLCIVCKEDSEMEESQNIFGRKSKSLGQGMPQLLSV